MNYYWNGKIATIVENLKLLLLLDIICSNCCYWRFFIGVVVVGDYLLNPLLLEWKIWCYCWKLEIVVVETIIKPTIVKIVVVVVKATLKLELELLLHLLLLKLLILKLLLSSHVCNFFFKGSKILKPKKCMCIKT